VGGGGVDWCFVLLCYVFQVLMALENLNICISSSNWKHISCMWNLCVLSALMKAPVQPLFFCRCVDISSDNLMPFALAIHNIKALLESWAHSKHRALTFTKMFLSNTLRLQLYCRYSVYSINIMWGTRKIKKHKQKGNNYCLFFCLL